MWAGAANNPGQYLTAADTATSDELQAAQQDQSFWNGVWSNFNPQSNVLTSTPSGPAFNNIAKTANGIAQAGVGGGPSGSTDLNQASQNRQASATGASRTEDLNNFMNNLNGNQKSAEERELSMFGNSQGQNAQDNSLFQGAPQQAAISQAETQQNIANEFNDYNQGQGNPGNEIGSAVGGFAGGVAGSKLAKSLFNNTGNSATIDSENED